jgi:UDPglucose--hexose-1-phosphate uridylyltransferase
MELRSERFTAELLDPRRGFKPTTTTVEVRCDPLTGQSCRLLPPGAMPPPATQDLQTLASQTRPSCPFCTERIDTETPRFPAHIIPAGRIRVGEALLFPNLLPYAKWSSVSVYSPGRHLLSLDELTPSLIADNLTAQVEFGRAVATHDPTSRWTSINANQLPPSGSSIFHPHLQGSANPVPTTVQRLFAELDPRHVRDFIALERSDGARLIASDDLVTWLAAFAPTGLAEIRGFVTHKASINELDAETTAAIASGLTTVLRLYATLGLQSFNLALHSAGHAMLVLRIVGRAYFGPLQRSDVMWSEHLHAEAATDIHPETTAERARALFSDRPPQFD